jgi:ribosomal protein L10
MIIIEKFEKIKSIKTILRNNLFILICQKGDFIAKNQITLKKTFKEFNLQSKHIKKNLFKKFIKISKLKNAIKLVKGPIVFIFSEYNLTFNIFKILKNIKKKLNLLLIYKNKEFYYDSHLKNLNSLNFKKNNLELYYFYLYFYNRFYLINISK